MVEEVEPRCGGFLRRFGFELFNKNGAARPSVHAAAGSVKNALAWAGVDKAADFFDAHSGALRTTADHLMHTHSLPLQVTGLALKAAVVVPINCGTFLGSLNASLYGALVLYDAHNAVSDAWESALNHLRKSALPAQLPATKTENLSA